MSELEQLLARREELTERHALYAEICNEESNDGRWSDPPEASTRDRLWRELQAVEEEIASLGTEVLAAHYEREELEP